MYDEESCLHPKLLKMFFKGLRESLFGKNNAIFVIDHLHIKLDLKKKSY